MESLTATATAWHPRFSTGNFSRRTVPLPEFALTLHNFNKQWRKVRDDLGVPEVTSHSFRKSMADLIDGHGLSARVGADQLGHAKISMTLTCAPTRARTWDLRIKSP